MSYDPEPDIQRYLERLSNAAHDLPKARRRELLGEIEQHIRQSLAHAPLNDEAEMTALLSHVGDPAEIAAAASDQAEEDRAPTVAFMRHRRRMILALVALVLVGLAIATAGWAQTYQPLAFAPAYVLPAGSVNTVGESERGALVGYNKHGYPFFGVTIQNTGPFTVRVLGNGRYAAAIPVLRGWSTRLLFARYIPLKQPVQGPFGFHGHAWRREPVEPLQSVDLAPGQIVMLLWLGSWHDCGYSASLGTNGTTTPPESLPIQYSFLWNTETAHIPLPGGLTIAPAGRNPLLGCHHESAGAVRRAATRGVPADVNNAPRDLNFSTG